VTRSSAAGNGADEDRGSVFLRPLSVEARELLNAVGIDAANRISR
jgi:hypothetical protein